MKIIDRYVIRQLLMPFGMGLLVFTFLLLLKPLQEYAETLVAKNISASIIGWLMLLLVPQALALTIPMSLLVGRSTRVLALAPPVNDIWFPVWRLKVFVMPWADVPADRIWPARW